LVIVVFKGLLMGISPSFESICALSSRLGSDPTLVQGAGGNVSLKRGCEFFIKASGFWLSEALNEDIFVSMRLADISAASKLGDISQVPFSSADGRSKRPSIETSLHALMPHKVVVHLHCVATLALAVRVDAESLFEKLFEGLAWAFCPYIKPGPTLSKEVYSILQRGAVDVLVLGNHGLVIGGDSVDQLEALLLDVQSRLAIRPAERPTERPTEAAPVDMVRLEKIASDSGLELPTFAICHSLGTNSESAALVCRGSLYPDHVVFLGRGANFYGDESGVSPVGTPKLHIVPGAGVLVDQGLNPGAQEMVRALALVAERIVSGSDIQYLSTVDEDELLNWDAELYRQSLIQKVKSK
jgi:rhamnose utilization protein RhaD (predicted bifunctional aldolase and dehydrogenase)